MERQMNKVSHRAEFIATLMYKKNVQMSRGLAWVLFFWEYKSINYFSENPMIQG